MKRYPPLGYDKGFKAGMTHDLKPETFPYLKYYHEVLEKNPIFVGDHVYGAYWRQQPLAMVLAKKQYELIQKGLDEDTAYNQALEYVNIDESKSYESLKEVIRNLKDKMGAKDAITTDAELAKSIAYWRLQLTKSDYKAMKPEDQGEIDYLIHSKILKWNEVDRERRMKDPIYFQQFENLRMTIFPEIKTHANPR